MTEQRFLRLLLYIILVCVFCLLLFRFLLPVLLPFLIALLLSQLTDPAIRQLRDRCSLSRGTAAGLVTGAVFGLLALVCFLLFQACAAELTRLTQRLPGLIEEIRGPLEALQQRLLSLTDRIPDGLGLTLRAWVTQLFTDTSALLGQASDLILSAASGIVSHVPGIFLFLVTTIVASFMIAAERDTIVAWLRGHLPEGWKARIAAIGGHLRQALTGWIRAELRLMGITFAVVTLGLFVLGIRTPLLMGAVTAVVDALPILGSGTVLIPWGLWTLLLGHRALGLGLLILYGLAAALRTTLEPRLLGRQIGLHPLLALLSMYAGFRLFGIGGMILLPIAAILARQFWAYGGFGH